MNKINNFIEESFRKFNIKDIAIDSRQANSQTAFFVLDERAGCYIDDAKKKWLQLNNKL